MGKASTAKKVSQAARTGGGAGRRIKSNRSYFWPGFVTIVVVLGTLGIVVSRQENLGKASPISAPGRDASPPRVGDHWHTAYAVNVCGRFLPPVSDQSDPAGIHTHGDGVIHVHPFRVRKGNPFTGRHANLGAFLLAVNGTVNATSLDFPDSDAKRNGEKCDGKPARVRAMTWKEGDPADQGTEVKGDPSKVRLLDRMLLTVAFLPDGAKIPQPPSAGQLNRLDDVPNQQTPPTPTPSGEVPALPPGGETAPGGEAPSTAPEGDGGTTATTAAAAPETPPGQP